jgi:hypothetical protein
MPSERAPRWSPAASAPPPINIEVGRQLLRADGADRCDDRHGHHQGRDLRPVAPLYRFKSEDEAIKMANDTPSLTLPRVRLVRGREGRGPPPISTAATSAASGASSRPSNTASSASTRASSHRNPAGEIAPFGGITERGVGCCAVATPSPAPPSGEARASRRAAVKLRFGGEIGFAGIEVDRH